MKRLLILLMLAQVSFAISNQQESMGLSVTEVSNLVTVDGALDFSQLLPGYNYSTSLTVRWNVPQAALKNINAKIVPLYVRITPKSSGSWLYFEGGQRSLEFTLSCLVEDDSCSKASALSSSFAVRISSSKDAAYPHDDGIIVNASLIPFESAAPKNPAQISGAGDAQPDAQTASSKSQKGENAAPAGTGFALLAGNPSLTSIFIALFGIGAIFLIIYFREYLFEKLVSPRERREY